MYMEIPQGFDVDGNRSEYVLRLLKNLYGQKQAGRVWNHHLDKGLKDLKFRTSKIDECVYYKGTLVVMVYVDDMLVVSPNEREIQHFIRDLGKNYTLTDEGPVDEYLGVKIERLKDGRVRMTQPKLTDQIISDLDMEDCSERPSPALSSKILGKDPSGKSLQVDWHYRSIIGKLNYLEKSTRPDLAYTVHRCARFSVDPKESHGQAVKHIVRYLKGTRDKGIIFTPNKKAFECWADTDFCGNWDKNLAPDDSSTAKSRSGYFITYAGCPLLWASKLQTEIALSTTEAEYMSLSQALREVIPLMDLAQEVKDLGIGTGSEIPKIYCRAFEDNSGALEMAKTHKMRPRTKHINVKFHHFREYVRAGKIEIHAVTTLDQIADIFTKPLSTDLFKKFRERILGW